MNTQYSFVLEHMIMEDFYFSAKTVCSQEALFIFLFPLRYPQETDSVAGLFQTAMNIFG